MHAHFRETELPFRVRGHTPSPVRWHSSADCAAGFHLLEREGARAVVAMGDVLERVDAFGVAALADEVFGRFAQFDDGDAEDGEEED